MPDTRSFLTKHEVAAWPAACAPPEGERDNSLAIAMARHGLNTPAQAAGTYWQIGCVSLEVTQRCNLDCTLCYLSDAAEGYADPSLETLFRRIDRIYDHYGPGTNIQVSGGDPTLRPLADLVSIVEYISSRGMNAALFTNGIRASRHMLTTLAKAGLRDVAFHVDMTQERRGYENECELNSIRADYIERARGLGIRILFNTTVFDGNRHEIAELTDWVAEHADDVHLASFQLQAETGRGVLGAHDGGLTVRSVRDAVAIGLGTGDPFGLPEMGHPDCNQYASLMVAGSRRRVLMQDKELYTRLFSAARGFGFHDRLGRWAVATKALRFFLAKPGLSFALAKNMTGHLLALLPAFLKGARRIHKLTIYIHNFMDETKLEKARCESCIFMVASEAGPISMCVHNAKRDAMLAGGNHAAASSAEALPPKHMKGRLRRAHFSPRHRMVKGTDNIKPEIAATKHLG
ncbi:MAG: radical SAM protein [Pseudomonadota bacterium]